MPISIISSGRKKKKRRQYQRTKNKYASIRMTTSQIKTQIEKLKKDNDALKDRIQVINTTAPRSALATKKEARLNDMADEFSSKVDRLSVKIKQHRVRYKNLEKQLGSEKKVFGGSQSNLAEKERFQNGIRVLENRLDRMLAKYNQSIAENRNLREQIETLREERGVFDGIYRKMEKELEEKKGLMAEVIESSNISYEDSEEAKRELERLKQQRKMTLAQYSEQSNNLDEIIHQNEMVQEAIKRKERDLYGANGTLKSRKKSKDLKSSMLKKRFAIGMKGFQEEKTELSAEDLSDTFTKLEEATGLKPDELIHELQETENNNFSLYTYSNELNTDIQKLERQIKDLSEETESYVTGEKSQEERKRNRVVVNLQHRYQETEERTKGFEYKNVATKDVLNEILEPLKNMYELIGVSKKLIIDKRGVFEIAENNVMFFLSQIEQKIDELVQTYLKQQQQKINVATSITTLPSHVEPTSRGKKGGRVRKKFNIKPPSTTDDVEKGRRGGSSRSSTRVAIVIVDDHLPLTRDELINSYAGS